MLSEEQLDHFINDWLAGWNSHDLERIVSHYAADIIWESPYVASLTGKADGRLVGREPLREYFEAALKRFPNLRFRFIQAFRGINSAVIHYESVDHLLAAEVFEFNEVGLVIRVTCHYRSPQADVSASLPGE